VCLHLFEFIIYTLNILNLPTALNGARNYEKRQVKAPVKEEFYLIFAANDVSADLCRSRLINNLMGEI